MFCPDSQSSSCDEKEKGGKKDKEELVRKATDFSMMMMCESRQSGKSSGGDSRAHDVGKCGALFLAE